MSVKKICLYAFLGALMYVLKMVMAPLPNIEPVSLMVILLASVYGMQGLLPLYVYIFLEDLTWGINFWSISYLYVWLLLFFPALLLREMKSTFGWALLAGFFGLFFGLFCAVPYLFIGGWQLAFDWWLAGLSFDLAHCAGNFLLTLLLFQPLHRLLAGNTVNTR